AVIGAGPVGCELAQAFARLGAKVTLVAAEEGLLPREDRDAASILEKSFGGDGIRVVSGGRTERVLCNGAEKRIEVSFRGTSETICVDEILVGAGREPNVDGLELAAAGVAFDAKGVTVDEQLRTTNPKNFAAGDVCSKYKFTHAADAMARIVVQNALY